MQHIKDILANDRLSQNILAINNGLLPLSIQNAIATSKIPVDTLPYSMILHAPAIKWSTAEPYIDQIMEPFGGYNASLSDGNWRNPENNRWYPEPIVLVKSYMTGNVLQQHLPATLQRCYFMGKALGESAIALEILAQNVMVIIPTGD